MLLECLLIICNLSYHCRTMTTTRKITNKEKRLARRSYWLIILIAIFTFLMVWVVLNVNIIPMPARIVALVICGIMWLVFIVKQVKMESELSSGMVEVVIGKITDKQLFGGNKSAANTGSGRGGKRTANAPKYVLEIEDETHWVKKKFYSKVNKDDSVCLVLLPKSRFIISLHKENS